MADASNFVHIQEASFWFGLFVLDRGLAEVLPAKIARGWIHIGVGALAFFYGVGWLSGLTFRLGVVIAAAAVLLVIVFLRSRRTVGTVPPTAPITSDWIAWIAKGSLAGVTAFLLIWLIVVAYDRVRSTGYGLSNLPSPSATNSPTPSYYPLPLTLRNLFDTDTEDVHSVSITNDFTLHNRINGHASIRLFEDLNEKVEFFSVFIPRSPDAFDLCIVIAYRYKSLLNELHQRFRFGTIIPGETTETWSRDLTLSGRVYIYLDDDLSLQQLATLEKLYNQNGLSQEFRSRAFLALHWMEKREILKTYTPPKR
jgi:hypothetical protein